MSVRRGFVVLTVGQGVAMVAAYATHVILARILGPADYGRYGVFLSVVSTVALILTAGLPEAISKYAAEHPAEAPGIFASGARLQLRFALAVTCLYALVSPLISSLLEDTRLCWELLLSALSVPPVALYSIVVGGFSGQRRFGLQAITVGAYGALRCVLSVGLAPFYAAWGAIIALVVAPVIVVGATLPALLRPGKRDSEPSAAPASGASGSAARLVIDRRALVRFAGPVIVFTVLLALLMNLDLFVVKVLARGPEHVGYYAAAATIAKIPYFGFSSLGVVLLPTVSAAAAENERALDVARRAIRWTFLASFSVAASVAALGGTILRTLYGAAYAEATLPLALLVISGTLFTLFFIIAYALNGLGQPQLAMRLTAVGVVIELGLALLFGRFWGAPGVALASCVAATAILIALLWAARAHLGIALGAATLARAWIALLVTLGVGWLMPAGGAAGLLLAAPLLLFNLGLLIVLRETTVSELLEPLGLARRPA